VLADDPAAEEDLRRFARRTGHEMIRKTKEAGVEIYACEASKQMLGWEKVKLIPEAKVVGAGTLNDLAPEANATMWF